MAGQSRTLKLSILADVDQLKKSLAQADDDVKSSASKIGDFSKKVGLAFAAAGVAAAAYAGKLAIDGVKSAIADEAAQNKLATTLRNVVGATNDQIKAIESQILKTSLLTGKTDEELRPSLDRLIRSTNDVSEAQRLQSLAMDIAAGTGKSLEAVSNALAKAHDGNFGALTKLGVSMDASIIKSKDFDAATASLAATFKDQASVQAETFQGKMDRLKVAFDEGKETVGSFILDAITPLVSGFVNKVVPAIQEVAAEIGPKLTPIFKVLGDYFKEVLVPAFTAFYNFIKDYIVPILNVTLVPIIKAVFSAFNQISDALKDNQDKLQPLADAFRVFATFIRDTIAPIIGTFISSSISGIAGVISALITVVADVTSAVSTGFTKIKNFFQDVKDFIVSGSSAIFTPFYNAFKSVLNSIISIWNKIDFGIDVTIPSWVPIFGGNKFQLKDIFPDVPYLAQGGIVTSPTLAMIGEAGPEAVIPLNKSGMMGNTFNITVNGAIDAEGTARTIVNVLNNSFYRGTGGATALVTS
jgi:phage-related protein